MVVNRELTSPKHFTDLKVWRVAHDLYLLALDDVNDFPNTKGAHILIDQLLRAIGSISANIAEGYSRKSTKHYISYLDNSIGTTNESENWYYKAKGAQWLHKDVVSIRVTTLSEIRKMSFGLIKSLKNSSNI